MLEPLITFKVISLHTLMFFCILFQRVYQNGWTNFIHVLHVYVTGLRKVLYIKVTLNSKQGNYISAATNIEFKVRRNFIGVWTIFDLVFEILSLKLNMCMYLALKGSFFVKCVIIYFFQLFKVRLHL